MVDRAQDGSGSARDDSADRVLDDLVAKTLDVSPSADFLARVRQRVASEAVSTGWWGHAVPRGAALTTAGMAIVAAGLVAMLWLHDGGRAVRPAGEEVASAAAVVSAPTVEAPLNPAPDDATATTPTVERSPVAAPERIEAVARPEPEPAPTVQPEPAIVVSAAEVAAFRNLVARSSRRQLTADALPLKALDASIVANPSIEDVAIPPIVVERLPFTLDLEAFTPDPAEEVLE